MLLYNVLILFIIAMTSTLNSSGIVPADVKYSTFLSSYEDVSGSIEEYRGSIEKDSKVVWLEEVSDFRVGNGIAIEGAGNAAILNGWLLTRVEAVEGKKITLRDKALNSRKSIRIHHDDSESINNAIQLSSKKLIFNFQQLNAFNIKLKSNLEYDGLGNCTLLTPVYYPHPRRIDIQVLADGCKNIKFHGFTLDGGKYRGVSGDKIFGVTLFTATNSRDIFIYNNVFQNSFHGAFTARGINQSIKIKGNRMIDTDVGVLGLPDYNKSLQIDGFYIEDNFIKDGTSEGISIESGMYDYKNGFAKNLIIKNNTIINKKNSGGIFYGARSTDVIIEGNTITGSGHGICTRDKHLEPKEALISSNVLIKNNTITSSIYQSMVIEGKNTRIEGNTISNSNCAIHFIGYNDTLTYSNNIIVNCEREYKFD